MAEARFDPATTAMIGDTSYDRWRWRARRAPMRWASAGAIIRRMSCSPQGRTPWRILPADIVRLIRDRA